MGIFFDPEEYVDSIAMICLMRWILPALLVLGGFMILIGRVPLPGPSRPLVGGVMIVGGIVLWMWMHL